MRGIATAAHGEGKHSALGGAYEPAGGGRDIILGADNWPIMERQGGTLKPREAIYAVRNLSLPLTMTHIREREGGALMSCDSSRSSLSRCSTSDLSSSAPMSGLPFFVSLFLPPLLSDLAHSLTRTR